MSAPAAISGTFADFRMVKGRKVCQLVVEVPIEQADAALNALGGVPQPHAERWVAIARLNETPAPAGQDGEAVSTAAPEAASPSVTEGGMSRRSWSDLKPSAQAAIRCGEPRFQKHLGAPDATLAAAWVRHQCGVVSRRDLDTDKRAATIWGQIDTSYMQAAGLIAEAR